MEGKQVRCPICGEGHEGSSSCDKSGEESSVLLQKYVKGVGRYFQDVNFGGEEGVTMVPCKGCSFYLKSVVSGMERMEELNKDVAVLEQSLWRKLQELKSDGDNVLSQMQFIREAIINRLIECPDLNQHEIYLRKGTEKACTALAVPMAELEKKLDWFKKWANADTGKIQPEVESTSSAGEGTCRVVSVTSMVTSVDDDSFEAGEVFQVKTEQVDDAKADFASTGDGEPVLEGVVKIEKEFVRETRQGNVYRTKEVSFSFGTGYSTVINAGKSAGEPMVIDLEEEEIRSTDAQNISVFVPPLPPPSQDIHMETNPERNELDEAKCSEEQMHLEVEVEKEIPPVDILIDEVSKHEVNCSIDMETFIAEISKEHEHTEYQTEATASLRKRSIADVDITPGKTDKVDVKMARKIPREFSVEGFPIACNSTDPDDDNDENKKWFSQVTALLRSKGKDDAALQKLFQEIPKLSPGLFHKLVLQLKEENKLGLLTSIFFIEFDDDCRGVYPLFHQIFRKINVEERTLDILSESGLDFGVLDSWQRNVLHSAIQGNQSISLLKSLIKRGANVKQVDWFLENLIHIAVKCGCTPETLGFLINEGVKVENPKPPILMLQKVDDHGRVFSLFKFLFDAGAYYPETVLPDYCKSKYEKSLPCLRELFEFIFSNEKVGWFNTKNCKGATPLHLALGCWKMDEENLQMLAISQVDFSIIDNQKRGCLHYAISGENWSPKTLQFLIDKGAPLTLTKTTGNFETLIHIAATNSAPWDTFEFLLEKGFKIGHKDSEGYTALDLAIQNFHEEGVITKLLIKTFDAGVRYSRITKFDARVRPNLSNRNPIIHVAIEHGTLEVVKHMLENGANVNELDSKGETSFLKAIQENIPDGLEKAKLLRRFGADVPSEVEDRKKILHNMAETEIDPEIFKYCIEEFQVGADATLSNGKTLLYSVLFAPILYSRSRWSKAKTLILEGADVNAKPEAEEFLDHNKKLQSPLHLFLYKYNPKIKSASFVDILILILERGANINEASLEGWTALHIIMDNRWEGSLEVAKLMVQFGADIHAKTKKGQSVLHIAAGTGDVEKIEFCLSKGFDVNALDINKQTCMEYLLNLLPAEKQKFQNEWAGRMPIGMKVLLESGANAKTKANLKHKIETRLGRYGESDLVTVSLKEMLSLLK